MTQRSRSLRLMLLCAVFSGAAGLCARADAALTRSQALRVRSETSRAYYLLGEKRNEEARAALEGVLSIQPGNRTALLELGYLHVREGRAADGVSYLRKALEQRPGDARLRMDVAYALKTAGDARAAEEEFKRVSETAGGEWKQRAEAELAAMRAPAPASPAQVQARSASGAGKNDEPARARIPAAPQPKAAPAARRFYLDFFASPFYASRFRNAVAFFEAQAGWIPFERIPMSFYLGGRYTKDSQSREREFPVVFSDNVATLAAGARIQPLGWERNLTLAAEADLDYNLIRTADHPDDHETNARVVLSDYYLWRGRWWGPLGLLSLWRMRGERAFTDLGASVGYYQRHRDNVIGYAQMREGFRLWSFKGAALSAYGRVNAVKDNNRDFFNNLAELGPGLELRPFPTENLSLQAEYVRGFYFGIEDRDPNPYGRQYNDFRILLLYGRRF